MLRGTVILSLNQYVRNKQTKIAFIMDEENDIVSWLWVGIVGVVIFSYSIYLISENWYEIRGTYLCDTDSFLKTEGTIQNMRVGQGQIGNGTRSLPTTYYYPSIEYSFVVDKVAYTSNKIAFADIRFKEYHDAKSYLSNFPVGTKVEVYYDPDDPKISVLDPKRKGSFVGPILGVLFLPLLTIVFILRRYFKSRHKQADVLVAEKLDELVSGKENE